MEAEEMVARAEAIGCLLVKDRVTMKMVRGFYNRMSCGGMSTSDAQAALAYTTGKYPQTRKTFYPEMKAAIQNCGSEEATEYLTTILSYHCYYGGDHS